MQGVGVERKELRLAIERGVDQTLDLRLSPAATRLVRFEPPRGDPRAASLSIDVRDSGGACVWSERRDLSSEDALDVRISARPGSYRLSARTDTGLEGLALLRVADGGAEGEVLKVLLYRD